MKKEGSISETGQEAGFTTAKSGETFFAAYLGTFDPLTLGHVDIIERASALFPSVIVGIGRHPTKNPCFSFEERWECLKEACCLLGNVAVATFDGLAVDFARSHGVKTLVRGLRSEGDYNYEMQMAMINRVLDASLESIFLPTRQKYSHVSSTLVKEVVGLGGEVPELVPGHVYTKLVAKLRGPSS